MSDERFTTEERRALLGLARSSIAEKMKMDRPRPDMPREMDEKSGAFVTLHKKGALRGCIGRFVSEGPITDTIREMARAAAFEDPRFPSLKPEELDQVDLEISVLTPMRRVESVDEIEVGRHGIYIIKGASRGVLLPQVATDYGWDRDTFLEHTCMKAGLDKDCWKDGRTEIYVFSAEVFGENDLPA